METETETSRDPISGQVGRIGVQGRIWGFWGGGRVSGTGDLIDVERGILLDGVVSGGEEDGEGWCCFFDFTQFSNLRPLFSKL